MKEDAGGHSTVCLHAAGLPHLSKGHGGFGPGIAALRRGKPMTIQIDTIRMAAWSFDLLPALLASPAALAAAPPARFLELIREETLPQAAKRRGGRDSEGEGAKDEGKEEEEEETQGEPAGEEEAEEEEEFEEEEEDEDFDDLDDEFEDEEEDEEDEDEEDEEDDFDDDDDYDDDEEDFDDDDE
jgi:hypothetical protein